jgi:hypothetical protein
VAKDAIPETHDALKLATAQLKYAESQREMDARSGIYVLLYIYLIVLIGYSIFVVTAICLTAEQVWTIPWHTLTAMGGGNFGLGASGYFFRSPMNHLFRRRS